MMWQEALASKYGLSAQLNCLNYRHLCTERTGLGSAPRWVLADLSREEIKFLQQAHGENGGAQSGWQSLVQEVSRQQPSPTSIFRISIMDCAPRSQKRTLFFIPHHILGAAAAVRGVDEFRLLESLRYTSRRVDAVVNRYTRTRHLLIWLLYHTLHLPT